MAGRGWSLPARVFSATLLGMTTVHPLEASARADRLQQAITAFEQRGFVIRREHPRCSEPQLFGLYVRGRREVVVCPKGNQLETLLHEGWHAVQTLCLQGMPLLGSDALLHQLGRRDRRELQLLYRPDQWQREAEARLMAREPLDRYIQTLDRVCPTSPHLAPKAD
ncbi:MAG: hypothetical protein VKI39_01070 [Synechococcus sp.]|nr:hypothetical protein [Synechococcus sp.]